MSHYLWLFCITCHSAYPAMRSYHIQVPAWDLDPTLQDQGWGKTWLPTLHLGQRGLCCLGQMGTSRWSTHEWHHEVLRLHRKHVRWQDLPMSLCLQAGRHHKEVWWIHQWASRSDVPTCPQGTNWQWQWCCNWVRSSTQADLDNPRCWHWAAQTTSGGQLWQEGTASTRDLQNILCCWIRWGCNVCRSSGTCCMPHPPDTWSKAADIIHTVPNCTHQHLPSRHNCPAWDSACKGCGKKGHWWAKCQSSNTNSLQVSHYQPWFKRCKKGRESQAAKAKTEKRPLHKDLFIAAMDCGTVGDVHPKEMIIVNISSQQCNEAYTVIKLPESASSKGTTSVHVKIDTGSGGDILPLHLFQQLHPKQTSPDGLPIGLDSVQTKLTGLQWVSDSSVWNPPWPHPLATKHSWGPTMHDPLILVHCRHTWYCSLGSPSMQEVSCGPKWTVLSWPLHPTGTTPTQAARVTKPTHSKNTKAQVHQIHWWLDERIAW